MTLFFLYGGFIMKSQLLQKARQYEEEQEKEVNCRPSYHLTPRIGWMNDPNGFCYFDGKYHLFYQYYPYDTNWGPMHWGHAVSDDLCTWDYMPCALAPDEEYDPSGCFSGTAIDLLNGKMLLLYTGVKGNQRQCIAIGDGIDFEKSESNPVIKGRHLPDGCSRKDFRDPKIWKEEDMFYCIAVNEAEDKLGQILKFKSKDALNWEYDSLFMKNDGTAGKMWECPDYFILEEVPVTIVSAIDCLAEKGNPDTYEGNLVYAFYEQKKQILDYGIDFYAPQTLQSPDGRRIMVAWMQNWETLKYRDEENDKYFGQMTFPREIEYRNGMLYQRPAREIEAYYQSVVSFEETLLEGESKIEGVNGRKLDLELKIPMTKDLCFTIAFAKNAEYESTISFCEKTGLVTFSRRYSGTRTCLVHERSCTYPRGQEYFSLRLLLDEQSAEAFLADGQKTMSHVICTPLEASEITFTTKSSTVVTGCARHLA